MSNIFKNKSGKILLSIIFLISIFLLILNVNVSGEGENPTSTITYTPTTETHCSDEKCYKVLYSGIRFIEEDSQWKNIEDARSLKGENFKVVYLENDSFHIVDVIDFNYSSITFNLSYDENSPNFSEYEHEIEDNKIKTKFKIVRINETTGLEYEEEIEVEIEENLGFGFKLNENPIGKKFKFGSNSTTIQLQDADTENLDDTYITETNTTENFGSSISLNVKNESGDNMHVAIKFDLTQIPAGVIEDAKVCLYVDINSLDSKGEGFNISVKHLFSNPEFNISDSEWTEGNGGNLGDYCQNNEFCWNHRPNKSSQYNITFEDTYNFTGGAGGPSDEYVCWNVTDMVTNEHGGGNNNVSMYFSPHNRFGTPSADTILFASKEDAVTERPYLNITHTPTDSTDPIINLNYPSNNVNVSSSSQVFSLTCSDDVSLEYCVLYGNWTTGWHKNASNSSAVNNSQTNFTVSNLPEGKYIWSGWANDSSLNSVFNNTNRTITIDGTAPTSSLGVNQIDNLNSTNESQTFDFKCSDNLGNIDQIRLYGNWSSGWHSNYTNTSYTNNTYLNISSFGIGEGKFVWGVYCNDSVGNEDWSANRTFTIDSTNPSIILNNPLDTQNFSSNSIVFSATITDTNLEYVRLYLNHTGTADVWAINGTNVTAITGSQTNFTTALPDGKYLWSYWANDSSGNSIFNDTNRTFTIDTTNPTVSLVSPLDNGEDSDGIVDFKYNVSDSNKVSNCSLFLDGSYESTDTTITRDTTQTITVNGPPEQDILDWLISCTDFLSNNGNSTTWQVDTKAGGGSPSGGGGGGAPISIEKIDVVALIQPQGISVLQPLDRSKLYKAISSFCLEFSDSDCVLNNEQKGNLSKIVKENYSIFLTIEDLNKWIGQYQDDKIETVEITESNVIKWNLFTSAIKVVQQDFDIVTDIKDRFFLALYSNSTTYTALSNRVLKSCSVIQQGDSFSCVVSGETSADITYESPEEEFAFKTEKVKLSFTSIDDENIFKDATIRVIKPLGLFIILGFVFLGGFIYYKRKKIFKGVKKIK